ncbi:MAG TPA: phosphoglycerate dehydrogenase [Terriglobia bacterium]|nr:phosphoglycerate dehydrogenase [Terriglobia bacterium]
MPNFKVLLLDGIDPAGVKVIERTGEIAANVHNKITRERLLEIVSDVDGIIVRSATVIDRELMQKATRLKVVGRAGVGVDNVDIETATERGVLVMNSPGGSTTTTAEHAIAMLFALARSIPQAYLSLKGGKWEKSKFKGVEITGKTLGVVGLGRIGSEVARKCQAMGMNVIAYDPFINADTPLSSGLTLVTLPAIFEQSDFISLHVPLTDATRNLVNKQSIASMKDGVRLINCARGGIVDENDLCEALKSGKVAGAALDVFDTEPNTETPLLAQDNFIATPHLGASTVEAQRKVSEDVCRQVADYLLKNAVSGALNFPQLDLGQVESYQHFVDLAGRIATFTSQISDGRLKSVSIRYSGEVCDMNLNYLTSVMVQRILVPMLREGVNLINAMHVAHLRGIKVEHTRVPASENFTNLITLEMKTESETHRVSGTVFTDRMPRIVDVDGFALEVIPRGHMIYFMNNDKPGVIGQIGTIMGECSVNIAGMQLGREHEGGRALALLLVDDSVRSEVIDRVRGLDNILIAKAIRV